MYVSELGEQWHAARVQPAFAHLDSAAAGRSSDAVIEAISAHLWHESARGSYIAAEEVDGFAPRWSALGESVPARLLEAATAAEDMHLIPGATVGKGRYRLLVSHGGPPTLQFWQALDTALDRQVALTFVAPEGGLSDDEVGQEQISASGSTRARCPATSRPGKPMSLR